MVMHGSFSDFIPGKTEGIHLMNYSRLMFYGVSDTGHPFWTLRISANNFGDFSVVAILRDQTFEIRCCRANFYLSLSPYTPTTSMNAANQLRQVECLRIRDARRSWGHGFGLQGLN
jgi:hypothetical protein